MSNFKESRIFLNFLKKNWYFLIVPSFLAACLGFLYQATKPDIHHKQAVLELKYKLPDQLIDSEEDIENKSLLADEIVSVVREEGIRKENGIEGELKIYKIGPMLIKVDVFGVDKDKLGPLLAKALSYVKSKYPMEERGVWTEGVDKSNRVLGLLVGAFFGGSAGLIFILFKTYLQKY